MTARNARAQRRRWSDRYIGISLGTEYFFTALFGKRHTHGLASGERIVAWRRRCHRLIDDLERYIKANVTTDADHRSSIEAALSGLHRAVNAGTRETDMVAGLARLCFLLLGEMPDHWERRVVNRPEHYLLGRYRSLHYARTPAQMATLIWQRHVRNLSEEKRAEAKVRELDNAYWKLRRARQDAKFVEMFSTRYPGDYLKLFA